MVYRLALLLILFSPSAEARLFEGTVRDLKSGTPISGAQVRVQATKIETKTDEAGRFRLESSSEGETASAPGEVTITAWHEGYLNGGTTSRGDAPADIRLQPIFPEDNKDYEWISPDRPTIVEWAQIVFWKGVSKILRDESIKSRFATNCSNCHADTTIKEWRQDAHSRSATNPVFLTSYNGTTVSGETNVFPGYRLDFPKSAGNCAACHLPAAAVRNPFGTDPNEVRGVAANGVFCDVCHKAKDVSLHPDGGYPGVLSMVFHRPLHGEQIFFGPYDDVIAGPDSFAPVFRQSRFCAPCHSARFWGTPIYSEYDEWLASPYASEGRQCQDCHMAPNKTSLFAVPEEKGGVRRSPEAIATHLNPGSRDAKFLADALRMELNLRADQRILSVKIGLTNEKAGHHFPTGVPMRNMILLVEARDDGGSPLVFLEGPVVPAWGGIGPVEKGNYAGLPGKGFAKILADVSKTFPQPNSDFHLPTPHWRQAVIVSDSRIPAKKTDVSEYRFAWREGAARSAGVRARVIYRRAFKSWIDAKGWGLEDLEIGNVSAEIPAGGNK